MNDLKISRANRETSSIKVTLQIYGHLSSINFQVAKCCAQDLFKKRPDTFSEASIFPMVEFEWTEWLSQRKNV